MDVDEALQLGDHHHARFGDGEAAGAVQLVVVADLGPRGHVDPLVDDRPADLGVPADVHALEEDRVLDLGVAVDRGRWGRGSNRSTWPPEMIEPWQTMLSRAWPRAASTAVSAKTNFGGGKVGLIGADRPVLVVQVQLRIDGDQVHVGLVVGVQRAHVAPVGVLLAVLVEEREGEDAVRVDHRRDDVAAEIVLAVGPRGVEAELLEEERALKT